MVYKSMWQANIYIEEINMRSVSEDDSRADWLRRGGISADIATRRNTSFKRELYVILP